MHLGKSYRVSEFIVWTRRQIYLLLAFAAVPVVLYQSFGLHWLTIPLTVVALLGTATSFIVGFKNVQTYGRTVEAQQIWTSILNSSRYWGMISRDFPDDVASRKSLVYRHVAWLTALRYQLRSPQVWETADKASNLEYRQRYDIPERVTTLEAELAKYLDPAELAAVAATDSKATAVLSLQGKALKALLAGGQISHAYYMEFGKLLRECYDQQGRVERIKNFPYPRQYAIINAFFVRAFCLLLPFGLLQEFDKLNEGVSGFMQGHMIWLLIPFSVMISWMYTSLEQVGESTENPFEGSANDVPITQICKIIERDMRGMLGETDLPALPLPRNDILL